MVSYTKGIVLHSFTLNKNVLRKLANHRVKFTAIHTGGSCRETQASEALQASQTTKGSQASKASKTPQGSRPP